MTKRQRNILYKKVLKNLQTETNYDRFRVCIELNNGINDKYVINKNGGIMEDGELYPEWFLFKGQKEAEWWCFYREENADELREISLQLCIEMTK